MPAVPPVVYDLVYWPVEVLNAQPLPLVGLAPLQPCTLVVPDLSVQARSAAWFVSTVLPFLSSTWNENVYAVLVAITVPLAGPSITILPAPISSGGT